MAENSVLKKDLKLTRRVFDQEVGDRQVLELLTSATGDLATVSGRANLAQAIINRLLTRQGELTKLGHPEYGSRLHTLIGELNNTRARGLAALYIRECLAQEPYIQKITHLTLAPASAPIDRDILQVTIAVQPVGQAEELTLALSLNLGG